MHGGFFSAYTDELVLTNMNLFLAKKGMFGNSKNLLTFPLSQVKVYNDEAQAVVGKATNGTDLLEVYFLNGQEKFSFQSGGKKKVRAWIEKINEVVAGKPVEDAGRAIPGSEFVAGALKDTINVFKGKFGAATAPANVAAKCAGCGASISGTQGATVSCEYCGTAQQL